MSTIGSKELKEIWPFLCVYLNQNDLTSLCLVDKVLKDVATSSLYKSVVITKDPVFRDDSWWIDCGKTYVAGYRSVKKTEDQNDVFLYDRIERLLESPNFQLLDSLIIQEGIFSDKETGNKLLQRLINKASKFPISNLDIRDSVLFEENESKLKKLNNLRAIRIKEVRSLNELEGFRNLKILQIMPTLPSFDGDIMNDSVKKNVLANIEELEIEDMEWSSLRLFYYFKNCGVRFRNLKSLKLNHVHGIHDYSKTLRELTPIFLEEVIPLGQLEALELEVACEIDNCSCLDDFLSSISPNLKSLRSLALIEKSFARTADHYTKENWDLNINKFILHLPRVEKNLQKLSIRHSCPINGIQKDSVEGNYIRRKRLYEEVLPRLKSLRNLIAPTFLQSLCSYEILVCDLLWNGCECEFCRRVLGIYDKYIMNHQYYSYIDGQYKDMIPTVFFAYSGDSLTRRFLANTDWDLKAFENSPSEYNWNFHGYEDIQHFNDFDCLFDETAFPPLARAISHFFNSYMDHLVEILPNLRACLLSGIYYQVNFDHNYSLRFD